MSERLLTVSRGAGSNLAAITSVQDLTWTQLAALLTAPPPVTEDKASVGWYCCARFDAPWRDNKLLIARSALTLDYDHIQRADIPRIQLAFGDFAYAIYTTASHTAEAPRIRVVLPLSRDCTADEFCAISRYVAALAGIELASRESHVPAQCMFMPSVKPGREFKGSTHAAPPLDVERILGTYVDFTDRSTWPHRLEGDSTHHGSTAERPTDKVGIVGEFCRTYDIPQAVEKFGLPYEQTANNPDRWTYTAGSRPEGAILYDDGQKLHSHHDTDPARGQHNSFDLVRLHRFSGLDAGVPGDTPIGDLPSYRAMCGFAQADPDVQAVRANEELDVVQEPVVADVDGKEIVEPATLARRISDVLRNPTIPRWLIPDVVEHGVIAVVAGPRGSYKSFLALDWSCRVARSVGAVYVVSGEGGDYDRRAKAWIRVHGDGDDTIPLYVVERRIDLNTKEGIDRIRADCVALGIRPVLIVIDTYSKLSGGLDENDNTAVKEFIGRLDNGFKRAATGFDATVLLVAHTGHSDAGRPRGASALAADTDAEYIVSRDDADLVSVTRERFKSSPELTPLMLRPEIVKLGYHDAHGVEITSLVLHPSEAIKEVGQRRKKVLGGAANQALYEQIEELIRSGPQKLETIAGILANRRSGVSPSTVTGEINVLLKLQSVFKTDDGMLSLTASKAIEVDTSEFDEEVA